MSTEWKKVTLVEKKQLSIDTVSLRFVGDDLTPHIPGQFYLMKIPSSNTFVSREYSIANSIAETNTIEFGVQKVENGIASSYLHALAEGTEVAVKGPMGLYFNWDASHEGTVFYIAGGSGIVPFMSMVRSHPHNKLILIASMKTRSHFSYYEELTNLALQKKISFIPTLTREQNSNWLGRKGRIDKELIQSILQKETSIKIFLCGRSSFVEDIYRLLMDLGVSDEMIQRERFG